MDSLFFPPYSKLIRFFHEQKQGFAIFDTSGILCHMNANFACFLWHDGFSKDIPFSLFETLQLCRYQLEALGTFDTYTFNWPLHRLTPSDLDNQTLLCSLHKDIQCYYLTLDIPTPYCSHIDYLLENTPLIDSQDTFTLPSLFVHMDIAICLCELVYNTNKEPSDFHVRYANPAFERLLGKSKSELIGCRVSDLCSDFNASWLYELQQAETMDRPIRFSEYIPSTKCYYQITISPSSLHHYLIMGQDITDQVRAEQTLARSDTMKVIGQLAGGIAHDFNNHLQIMQSYGDLMTQHLDSHPDSSMSSYLNSLLSAINQSSALIHQLLNYSKSTPDNLKPLPLHDVLRNVKNIFAVSLQKNVHLHLFLDADNPVINGDSALIQNAFLNLCINSRDALINGGVIQISTSRVIYDKPVSIGLYQLPAGHYVRCSIWDNGEGIETEDPYTIFEPFFTTKSNKGTGMGLSAVDSMIKHHKGAIDVHSVRHEWTQFDLYFPVLNLSSFAPSSKPIFHYDKRSYRILLVDDEPVLTQVIAQFLETEGYIVHTYTNSEQVIADISTALPTIDVALFDKYMPAINGYELLRQLIVYLPNIQCIFLSGASDEASVPSDIASHVLAEIKKPVNLHDLHTTIQRLLQSEPIVSDGT